MSHVTINRISSSSSLALFLYISVSPSVAGNSFSATYENVLRPQWPSGLRHEMFPSVQTLSPWVSTGFYSRQGCLCVLILCLFCLVCVRKYKP
jgi:hypothetical protein